MQPSSASTLLSGGTVVTANRGGQFEVTEPTRDVVAAWIGGIVLAASEATVGPIAAVRPLVYCVINNAT